MTNKLHQHLAELDWQTIQAELDERGYALTDSLLSSDECNELVRMYGADELFRNRVVMERHNFGRGEYRYFADPLPSVIARLREFFYAPLSLIANEWAARMKQSACYPATLSEFLKTCASAGQAKPTPLLLRYKKDDYNCLHQDIYGEVGFPLQVACVLSEVGQDYSGGEFLLSEQRPRAQTRAEAITIRKGQFIIFPNHHRPMRGTRGDYRVNMRHGVSRLRSGERYALGIIFHNAK